MTQQPKPAWFKSSYSGTPNNECVECAVNLPQSVLIRDSKVPDGPHVSFSRKTWGDFAEAVHFNTLSQH